MITALIRELGLVTTKNAIAQSSFAIAEHIFTRVGVGGHLATLSPTLAL